MHPVDLTIIAVFFVAMFVVALLLRRRSARNIDSYYLGDRSMRWWMLGASGMASNVDMAGTMVIASLLFLFGFKGFMIELRGGVVLIMAFYLAFMGKWTRRSGKMTVAEWMSFRFGAGLQGSLPRLLTAIYNIVFLVWAMAYFTLAATKFFDALLPTCEVPLGPLTLILNGTFYSTALIVIVMMYTTLAGFTGVVWTDVLQGGLILFLSLYVSAKAFFAVDAETLRAATDATWQSMVPPWEMDVPKGYDTFHLFAIGATFYLLKTAIDGMSGAGGYLAQRYFAARDERECGLLSAFWISLMSFRWPLMMGIAVLGFTVREHIDDPELVLPVVIRELMPTGILGLMLVGLLGAAMSTYSSFMNAGSAYFVKDIYQRYLRKTASERELVWVGYVSTIAFVVAGLLLASQYTQINDIWGWINMGLGAGLILPNFMRWYWWRFNGYGFAAGAATGMISAFAQAALFPHWSEFVTFGAIAGASMLAMIVVSLLTAPIPRETLFTFYRTTCPFGLWGPIRRQLAVDEQKRLRAEHRFDVLSLLCAVPWQLALFTLPMMIIIKNWWNAGWLLVILMVLTACLYHVWYRRLSRALIR
ncbi:MAG: sodium:solute symporter [Phycisphaerae bacterium]|nr:sodium:solute symporter [Phycisphaerae bacterium]